MRRRIFLWLFLLGSLTFLRSCADAQQTSTNPWVVERNQDGRLELRIKCDNPTENPPCDTSKNQQALDMHLKSIWYRMKDALRAGDTATAASYFVKDKQATYKRMFDNLTIPYSEIDSSFGDIVWEIQHGGFIDYRLFGGKRGGAVIFRLEEDNQWRLYFV